MQGKRHFYQLFSKFYHPLRLYDATSSQIGNPCVTGVYEMNINARETAYRRDISILKPRISICNAVLSAVLHKSVRESINVIFRGKKQ